MSESEVNFELTRSENDSKLLSRVSEIESGQDIKVLEPFARAYLGLFYEIDKNIAPEDRIAMLANAELKQAVLNGFVNALQRDDIPSPSDLGEAISKSQIIGSGYVLLAGIDRLLVTQANDDMKSVLDELPNACLQSALIAYYANSTQHPSPWFNLLLDDTDVAIPALTSVWEVMMQHNAQMLIGLREIVSDESHAEITRSCLLAVLEKWQTCKLKTFKELIFAALRYTNHDELLKLSWRVLNQSDDNPAPESKKLLWYMVAFLLSPDEFAQILASYIGRLKQKVLPLLDQVIHLLEPEHRDCVNFTPMVFAHLLRITAPIFTPHEHSYGNSGAIDVNSKNVMRLFHELAIHPSADAADAIKWLGKARVMKIYNAVIKHAAELNKSVHNGGQAPGFDEYLSELEQTGKLVQRKDRFN